MANKNYLSVLLKGIAMGSADVIPGVSGGTIAFITGIYEELINSIKSIDMTAVKLLCTLKLGQFWKKINGNFLFSLLLGIGIAIFSLAKVMKWLLVNEPIALWSFFFGLIIASTILIAKKLPKWTFQNLLALILGIVLAYTLTSLTPASTPDTWWFVMISGAIAICAMILPGISGAFILVLLSKYEYILHAVAELQIGTLLIFAIGAIAGLLSFSHFLSWLLAKHHNVTIAVLTGFMAGSLKKIWPWKLETIRMTNEGSSVIEKNILPGQYESVMGVDAQVLTAILLCIAGFALIWIIEGISNKMEEEK